MAEKGVFKIRFSVVPDKVEFSRAFEDIAKIGSDLRPAFEKVANEFYDSEERTFSAEGGFESKKRWADLSPGYAAWKTRHYPGRLILVLSGAMKASLTSPHAPGSVYEVTKKFMIIGTDIPYASEHQLGVPGRGLPVRKVVELTGAQKTRWVNLIHKVMYDKISDRWVKIRGH